MLKLEVFCLTLQLSTRSTGCLDELWRQTPSLHRCIQFVHSLKYRSLFLRSGPLAPLSAAGDATCVGLARIGGYSHRTMRDKEQDHHPTRVLSDNNGCSRLTLNVYQFFFAVLLSLQSFLTLLLSLQSNPDKSVDLVGP